MKIFTGSVILLSTIVVSILPVHASSKSNIIHAATLPLSSVGQKNIAVAKSATASIQRVISPKDLTSSTDIISKDFLISKQDKSPTTESDTIDNAEFSNYKSIIRQYSPEQKKRLLNILNSQEAKNVNSIEELDKLIGDQNLTQAIQKDTSSSSQTSRINWWKIIKLLIEILEELLG